MIKLNKPLSTRYRVTPEYYNVDNGEIEAEISFNNEDFKQFIEDFWNQNYEKEIKTDNNFNIVYCYKRNFDIKSFIIKLKKLSLKIDENNNETNEFIW